MSLRDSILAVRKKAATTPPTVAAKTATMPAPVQPKPASLRESILAVRKSGYTPPVAAPTVSSNPNDGDLATLKNLTKISSQRDLTKAESDQANQAKDRLIQNKVLKVTTVPGRGQFTTNLINHEDVIKLPRAYGTMQVKAGSERNHVFSVGLGGTSEDPNLEYLKDKRSLVENILRRPTQYKNRQEGRILVEREAIDGFNNGKYKLNEARARVLNWDATLARDKETIAKWYFKPETLKETTKSVTGFLGKAVGNFGGLLEDVATGKTAPQQKFDKANQAVRKFAVDVAQGTARSGATAGVQVLKPFTGVDSLPKNEGGRIQQGVHKILFGNEDVESIDKQIEKAPERAKGIPLVNRLSESQVKGIAPFAVVGQIAMDLTGLGGEAKGIEKAALKRIAESKSADEIVGLLTKVFKAKGDLKPLAERLTSITKPEEIRSILKAETGAKAVTQSVAPELQALAEKAKQARSVEDFTASHKISDLAETITGKKYAGATDSSVAREAMDTLKKNGYTDLKDFYAKVVPKAEKAAAEASKAVPEAKAAVKGLQEGTEASKLKELVTEANKVPAEKVAPELRANMEREATTYFKKNEDSIAEHILSKPGAKVIDSDELRAMIPGFKELKAEHTALVHEPASDLSKRLFTRALKTVDNPVVKFTAGGSGSGKSELALHELKNGFDGIIYDGTFADLDSSLKKIKEAIAAGKQVEVYGVIPRIESAWKFVQKRAIQEGRTLSLNDFVDKHVGAMATLRHLVEQGEIKVNVKDVRDIYKKSLAKLEPFTTDKQKVLDIVGGVKYNKDELINRLQNVKLSEKSARKARAAVESKNRLASSEVPVRLGDDGRRLSQDGVRSNAGGTGKVSGGVQPGSSVDVSISGKPEQLESQAGRIEQSLQDLPLSANPKTPIVAELSQKSVSYSDDIAELEKSQFVNTNRLNISEDAKGLIKSTIEEIKPILEKKIGSTLTNKEVEELANNSSRILKQAVGRQDTLEWETAMLLTRKKLAALAEAGSVTKEYIDTLQTVKTQGTNLARRLQSLSINADPKMVTSQQQIIEAVLDVEKNADEVLKAAKGVNFNDPVEATNFYRKFVKPKMTEWLDLLRYNSMLSSPKTHIINAFSNAVNTVLIAPVEKALLGQVDFLRATLTGTERRAFAGEGFKYMQGYFGSVGDASRRFMEVLKGRRYIENLDTRGLSLAAQGVKGKIASTLSYPLKMLEASDQFFKELAYQGELAALNLRQAKGVSLKHIEDMALEDATYRLYRQELFHKNQGTVLDAIDVFTNKLESLRKSKNPIVSTLSKFTVPFVRTPMNIFKQGIEYSPAGFLTAIGAADKQHQIVKAMLGTTVFAGAATMLSSGRLTWGEPTEEKKKQEFRAAGMQPYSIKLGDKWVSFQKLPPALAFPMAMVAALDDLVKQGKAGDDKVDMVLSGIAKYGEFLADQSYAKSVGDLMAAFKGGEAGISKVISNYPQQVIPFRALTGWLARLTDPTQRKVDSSASFIEKQMQLLMMNYPGLSQDVPARLDTEGKPIPNQMRFLNAFSPLQVSNEVENMKDLFVVDELITYAGRRELTPDETSEAREAIRNLVQNKKLTTKQAAVKIKDLVGRSVDVRMEQLLTSIKDKTPEERRAALKDLTDPEKKSFIKVLKAAAKP